MPWQGRTPMDLRRGFIEDYLTDAWRMTELCAMYQVSRKTGYKMVARFEEAGWAGLADRSRRPRASPQAVPAEIATAVCQARVKKPGWGARKIGAWLRTRAPGVAWPSHTTIHAIWQRVGLVDRAARARVPAVGGAARLRPATTANDVWTVDFKGDFRLGAGLRCYPLTVRDLASRYTLRCDALAWPDGQQTRERFTRAFREFGLPACLRSDNGEPFAGPGLAGLSRLNIWWRRLGIAVEQIDPGRPEQNGAHEQFHRVLKRDTTRPPAGTLTGQQRRFDTFRREYNEERPHEALGNAVPAAYYRPSSRLWPSRLPALEYPGHWEPRRVRPNGRIDFGGHSIFLSRALADEWVALAEVDEGIWTVHFAAAPLARWIVRDRLLCPVRVTARPDRLQITP
jgi:putative transposase